MGPGTRARRAKDQEAVSRSRSLKTGLQGVEPSRLTAVTPWLMTRRCSCELRRKEVIQPQVPLRLPCYDFTPVTSHSLGTCLPCGLARPLLEQLTPMV